MRGSEKYLMDLKALISITTFLGNPRSVRGSSPPDGGIRAAETGNPPQVFPRGGRAGPTDPGAVKGRLDTDQYPV